MEVKVLKSREKQLSFSDTNYLCCRLIPEDSFYRKFREIVWPLIEDKDFQAMYADDKGRPAISPALLAMGTILQFYRNLSDREMERACMYDIEVKYALGLSIEARPFDHSSLGDFRKRLLEHGKEKEVFDKILDKLVEKGLIKKNEIQRIDATHIIADIAIPTVITLVKKGLYEIFKPLKKRHKEILEKIGNAIDMREYTKEEVNKTHAGKMDRQKREKRLVKIVNEALTVLKYVKDIHGDKILERRVELLRRILLEQIEIDKYGEGKEKNNKNKPKDMLVSPIDPDARYGAKSKTKKFTGYKANLTEETGNRFITNIKAMPGNQSDGRTAVETITEQERHGIKPSKVIGDTAYSDGAYRKLLEEEGIQMVAPQRVKNDSSKGVYPKSMFQYDKEKRILICPEGIEGKIGYRDRQKEIVTFHFPMTACQKCSGRVYCTKAKEGRRTVGMSAAQESLFAAEKYNLTEQFKAEMKLRPAIEGKISELKRYHGLYRARYRGLSKVSLQCYFTVAAVNIKRWINIITGRLKPKIPVFSSD